MTHLPKPESQSCSVISSPDGVNQAMSGSAVRPSVPRARAMGLPARNRRRRNTGCPARRATTPAVNPTSPAFLPTSDQSIQAMSLSWA